MRRYLVVCLVITSLVSWTGAKKTPADKWIPLFDGKSIANWKVGANAETFSVDSGMIIVHGKTAHLF